MNARRDGWMDGWMVLVGGERESSSSSGLGLLIMI